MLEEIFAISYHSLFHIIKLSIIMRFDTLSVPSGISANSFLSFPAIFSNLKYSSINNFLNPFMHFLHFLLIAINNSTFPFYYSCFSPLSFSAVTFHPFLQLFLESLIFGCNYIFPSTALSLNRSFCAAIVASSSL